VRIVFVFIRLNSWSGSYQLNSLRGDALNLAEPVVLQKLGGHHPASAAGNDGFEVQVVRQVRGTNAPGGNESHVAEGAAEGLQCIDATKRFSRKELYDVQAKFERHLQIGWRRDAGKYRDLVFQGIRYQAGLSVDSSMSWDAWRFGYQLDVVARSRGHLGLIVEAKYTDVRAELSSPVDTDYARAQAPIPAIGAIGRVYVTRFTPLTAEFTAFRMPDDLVRDYRAHLYDFDVYPAWQTPFARGSLERVIDGMTDALNQLVQSH